MKFLVDAQLPTLLCEILQNAGFEAIHVDELPQGDETPDKEIAKYADSSDSIVITKDADFYHGHMLLGQPKKLLLITTGNIRNRQLFDLFRANFKHLQPLFEQCDYVEMSNERLIGHKK